MVDRGWVPFEMDEPPVAAASPPTGAVEVEGTLFAPQPGGAGEIQAGEDRVTTMRTVDVEAIGRDVPYELVGWFLQLRSQTPPSGELARTRPAAGAHGGIAPRLRVPMVRVRDDRGGWIRDPCAA